MTVEELKNELSQMEAPVLQELSIYILQLRRSLDPDRRRKMAAPLDSSASKWLTLDEMQQRLDCK